MAVISGNKRPLKTQHQDVNRALIDIYDTINALTSSVNNSNNSMKEYEGKIGDLRVNDKGLEYRAETGWKTLALGGDDNTPLVSQSLQVSGMQYPQSDGSTGQSVITNGSGRLSFVSHLTSDGGTLTGDLLIKKVSNDANPGNLTFEKNRVTALTANDGDGIGALLFKAYNNASTPELIQFAKIESKVTERDDGAEGGQIDFYIASHDGGSALGFQLIDGDVDGEVDVTIGAGAASTTAVAGNITVGGTVDGVDIAARDLVLTSTTTTANAALPKAGGTMTGDITMTTDEKVIFGDAGEYIVGDGTDLHIVSSGDIKADVTGGQFTIYDTSIGDPDLVIESNSNDALSGTIFFKKEGRAGVAEDYVGMVLFNSEDAGNNPQNYAYIYGRIDVSTEGEEAGRLELGVASHDGGSDMGLQLVGGSLDAEVDVNIGKGASSITAIAGDVTMNSSAAVRFGHTDEFVSGNGTDLTIASGNDINLMMTTDLEIVVGRNINANIAGNFNIDVDGGEARLTDDSETDNVFTPAHDADIATKKYVDDNVLKTAVVTLTEAQCTALHSTGVTLVAAPGSNKITLVQDVVLFIDRAATQTNSSCDLFVSYGGATSLSGSIIKYKRRFMYGVTTDMVMQLGEYSNIIATSLTGGDNQKVAIKVDSAITSGCINSIKCVVKYYVYDNS